MTTILILTILLALVAWAIFLLVKTSQHIEEQSIISTYQADNLYSQLESLTALYHEIKPNKSFPQLRDWAASPDFLLEIYKYCERENPKVIVECSSGASTIVLAYYARKHTNIRVLSLEHDKEYASKTQNELHRHGLAEHAAVIHAPLKEYAITGDNYFWYDTDQLVNSLPATIDLIIVDGPPHYLSKNSRYPALPLLNKNMSKTGALILDDANRKAEKEIVKLWAKQFNIEETMIGKCEKGCVQILIKQI